MKSRTKEEMAEYQRKRRGVVVTPDVTPGECNTQNVTPVLDPRGTNFGRTDKGRLGHGFDPVGKVYDAPDGKWVGDSFVSKRYKLGRYLPPRPFNRKELERERVIG